jgi:hypothetical protein
MYLIALILTTMVVGSFCVNDSRPPTSLGEEPVFGIELSMENIIISVAFPHGHAKGLAAVKGDKAYQTLMESYFELCSSTHYTQTPPWTYAEYRAIMAREYQTRTILRPDLLHWYDWSLFQILVDVDVDAPQTLPELDEHSNYTDIAILASAVGSAKRAAAGVLAREYNITMPERPFVSIAAPSWLWTAIEPETCAGGSQQDCESASDAYPSTWHHVFVLKISDAVHRAGFRRESTSNINTSTQTNNCQNRTSPIAPAGHAAFWNPSFQVGAAKPTPNHQAANSGTDYEGQPALVVEPTNFTLSMWTQQKGQIYSPWSTKPQLGVAMNQDFPAYMRYPEDPAWSDVVSMIERLRKYMVYPDGEQLEVYLIGDAWEYEMVEAFRSYLRSHKHTDINVEFRGVFAASDGAACVVRKMCDACGV